MGIELIAGGELPLHRQIFEQVASRIVSGTFPSGFRLPPIRELATDCGAHRNTVSRAYADLEAAGFVQSHVGRGTFVTIPTRTAHAPLPPPATSPLPWSSLLSRAARSEALERAQRYPAATQRRDLINLSRMQPSDDLLPHAEFRRCLDHVQRRLGARLYAYAPPEGIAALREEVSALLGREGVPVRADDLVITSGSGQAIDLIARSLLDPGDTALLDAVSYHGAIALFQTAGANLVTVPSDGDGPNPAALGALDRQSVKLLYTMPNCHNPIGSTISAERRAELVRWSQRRGVPLVEDDYGAGLALDATPPPPALRTLSGEVIYVSTFSKRLLPGLRIGFVASPPALRPTLVALKKAVDSGCSPLIQHALAEFLSRGYLEAHLRRALPEYRRRRDAMLDALQRHMPRDIRYVHPSQGVVLWLELPADLPSDAVYHALFEAGVQVSPGALWSVGNPAVSLGRAQPNGLRLVFCNEPPLRITEGIRRLGKLIPQLRARHGRRKTRPERAVDLV